MCAAAPLRANRDRQATGAGSLAASESPSSASASGSSGVSDTAADDPLACLAGCGAAAAAAAAAASGGGSAHPIASSACSVSSSEALPSALAHVPNVDPAVAAMAMASSDALASAAGAAGLPFLLSCLPTLLRGLGSPAPAPANLSLPPSERLLQLAADSLASSNATSSALVPPAPLPPVSAAAALLSHSALGAAAGSEPLDLSVHANNVSPKLEENGSANGGGVGAGVADDPKALLGRLLVALSASNPLLKSPIAPSPFEDLIASAVYAKMCHYSTYEYEYEYESSFA